FSRAADRGQRARRGLAVERLERRGLAVADGPVLEAHADEHARVRVCRAARDLEGGRQLGPERPGGDLGAGGGHGSFVATQASANWKPYTPPPVWSGSTYSSCGLSPESWIRS